MSDTVSVAITGCGIFVPGIADTAQFCDVALTAGAPASPAPASPLRWKGLRYKDRATKLALAAAGAALDDARCPATAEAQESGDSFGVVVSSNLGNVDTVCRALKTIRGGGAAAGSPMDLPNCSSNVIASTIAICAGLRGLNVMLCNGATSGTDALYLAMTAIRARRADRMLVVGVEATTAEAVQLMQASAGGLVHPITLGEGAGAIVLESAEAAASRGARPYGYLAGYGSTPCADVARTLRFVGDRTADLWLTPNGFSHRMSESERRHRTPPGLAGARQVDLSSTFGDLYGATGVLQAIAASWWVRQTADRCAVGTSGAMNGDGHASFLVEPRPRGASLS